MKRTTRKTPILVCDLKPAGPNGTLRRWCKKSAAVALAAAALLTAASSPAAQLTWDAGNTNNGATIDAASGSWNTDTTTNFNWNNGSINTNWTQTSTTAGLNGAIFAGADAAAGTYQVALDGVQIAITNMAVNVNGYAFSGSPVYLPTGTILSLSNGVNVTFNNNIIGNNATENWRLGLGGAASSMSVLGSVSGGQFAIGSTNGSTLWLGGNVSGGVITLNANVIHTNGTWANTATWQVGRPGASIQPDAGKAAFPGIYTMDGVSAILNLSKPMQIARAAGGVGTVIIKNGTVNLTGNTADSIVSILNDNLAVQGSFLMQGGTLNVGSSSAAGPISLARAGTALGAKSIFSQSGGTIKAWGGIISGAASGTYLASTSAFTNSGGFLYIGNVASVGISRGAASAPTNYFVFSGGTVGALQSWISTVPLTLDTLNGNITFQCADDTAASFNIGLSGALTGPGGLFKTGGGTLTLSGANNYEGSTVVSNGILKIVPLLSPANGSLTLDGSAASPSLSVAPASAGQFMTVNGNLTYAAGTVTADFNFGALPPSSSVAPIQVTNNVVCTVTPDITIVGSAIPVGTYPLIKYTGSVSGTLPAAPTVLPAATTGYITNITATKTIALVVTSSPVTASLAWRVGSGGWALITNQNWTLFGGAINYTEPNAVQFDDTATGPFPVTITNLAAVNPSAITVLGTNVWTVLGNGGSIGGVASLTKAGNGTVTLTGTNTYSGGTTVSGGQLNINNGGNSAANSAIGTGSLTLALNAKVDNTSGQSVTLQPTIAQNWQDDWTYVGSTNFNTGAGAVALGSSVVLLTVSNNVLEVGGAISDGGNVYKLQKAGSGTLTLGTDNSFSGGMQLDSGLLRLKTANGLGNGSFTISGSATFDNISGADMAVTGISGVTVPASATITYLGTSGSMDFGILPLVQSGEGSKIFNVASNTLTFGGAFTSGNSTVTKTGQGKLVLGGSGVSQFTGNVNEGELVLAHDANQAIGSGNASYGLLAQSNAVAKLAGTLQNQIPDAIPVKLNAGGVFDMNGNSETVSSLSMTNGLLRNGAVGGASTLTAANVVLRNTNNLFDVPDAGSSLVVVGNVTGTGSLVKTGSGSADLQSAGSYTGNTTVSAGTLTLNSPFLVVTSTVTIYTNGILNLNFAGAETNTVGFLVVNGVSKPAGLYNASTDSPYLAGAGSLLVVPPVTINPLPGTIQVSVSGSTLSLGWPTNLGWILQNQTNTLNVGLVANSNAWFNVPGSDIVTNTSITINPANGAVFYRMVHP